MGAPANVSHAPRGLIRRLAQSENSGSTPIYITANVAGHVLQYRPFAKELATEYSVFGLLNPFTLNAAASGSIAETATVMAKELLRHRHEGPYVLLGHSFGGCLASEVAQALQSRGKTVCLIVLDTQHPMPARRWMIETFVWLQRRLSVARPNAERPWYGAKDIQTQTIIKAHIQLYRHYQASVSGIPTLLLRANRRPLSEQILYPKHLGWRRKTRLLKIVSVDATHTDLIKPPFANASAQAVLDNLPLLLANTLQECSSVREVS